MSVTDTAIERAEAAEAAEPAAQLLERVDGEYTSLMRPLAYGEMEMEGGGRYAHYYNQNIADAPADSMSRSKMKRYSAFADACGACGEGWRLPYMAPSIYGTFHMWRLR